MGEHGSAIALRLASYGLETKVPVKRFVQNGTRISDKVCWNFVGAYIYKCVAQQRGSVSLCYCSGRIIIKV